MTLQNIEHLVVVCFENRSLDNLLGYLYQPDDLPQRNIPDANPTTYDGLAFGTFSNKDPKVNGGNPVYTREGTQNIWPPHNRPTMTPTPDPGEPFKDVKQQLSGNMGGFLSNYNKQKGVAKTAAQIMESYSSEQLPVLSTLARSFAVSDAWFCSVPTQTWPNRSFIHAGTSDGNIVNFPYTPYDIDTIYNVLERHAISWNVFADTLYTPALTRIQFTKLWDFLGGEFDGFSAFQSRCAAPADALASHKLPTYSFVEPRFIAERDAHLRVVHSEDYHPPHDVRPAEAFLTKVYNAVATSPYRDRILLVITFDEHGGTYDHVLPGKATPPDKNTKKYAFDQFGVRVPAILISSYVEPGAVFRSETDVPYDHTSILATLRDWQSLSDDFLPSKRIEKAPTFDKVLTLSEPRSDWPTLGAPVLAAAMAAFDAAPAAEVAEDELEQPLDDLGQSIVVGTERMLRAYESTAGTAPAAAAAAVESPTIALEVAPQMRTVRDATDYLRRRMAETPTTAIP
jgi:phospholipase C